MKLYIILSQSLPNLHFYLLHAYWAADCVCLLDPLVKHRVKYSVPQAKEPHLNYIPTLAHISTSGMHWDCTERTVLISWHHGSLIKCEPKALGHTEPTQLTIFLFMWFQHHSHSWKHQTHYMSKGMLNSESYFLKVRTKLVLVYVWLRQKYYAS